jgi:hypothetical protein
MEQTKKDVKKERKKGNKKEGKKDRRERNWNGGDEERKRKEAYDNKVNEEIGRERE